MKGIPTVTDPRHDFLKGISDIGDSLKDVNDIVGCLKGAEDIIGFRDEVLKGSNDTTGAMGQVILQKSYCRSCNLGNLSNLGGHIARVVLQRMQFGQFGGSYCKSHIADPAKFLFNLAQPRETIQAVSESAMREVIAKSELAPILNRDRAVISAEVRTLI